MVLKEHDSIESVPEALRGEYAKGPDGKFRPVFEGSGGWALEDVAGLRLSLGKERGRADALDRRVKEYDGIDAQAARDAFATVEQLKSGKPDEKVQAQIASVREAMAKAHGSEKAALEAKAGRLEAKLREVLVTSAAARAIGEFKGDAELLMPHVQSAVKVVEVGDSYEVRVVDGSGNPLVASNGDNMDLKTFVGTALREKFPAAFPGSGAQGSGASGSRGAGGAPGRFTITRDECKDVNKYAFVKAEAEKAGQTVQII